MAQKIVDYETMKRLVPEYFRPNQVADPVGTIRGSTTGPEALPDIDGPGAVLSVGQVFMKVTNYGFIGNPVMNRSSDPSAQWPGASAIEYLYAIGLAVGAANPQATDASEMHRVSFWTEWRPPTLDPEDKIYRAYDGIINGQRFENDDNDYNPFTGEDVIDEDFLDGRDNDGDGKIDEDHAAIGQQTYSLVMRDDTIQAIRTINVFGERHVPLGLECHQRSWAYALPGFNNFNITEYEITNRSGHTLDSLFVGFYVDMDCGPLAESNYYAEDFDIPSLPNGEFTIRVGALEGDLQDPLRLQQPHSEELNGDFPPDSGLCPRLNLRINGFSVADDNGDNDRTIGIPHFFLVDMTTDPLGASAPSRVEFHHFRSFTSGTSVDAGGFPRIDRDQWEVVSSSGVAALSNIDPVTGFISASPGDTKGDFASWCSVGPYRFVPDGGRVKVTIGFGIAPGRFAEMSRYPNDYQRYLGGLMSGKELMDKYPPLANAWSAQIAFEGIHEARPKFPRTNFHGREVGLRAGPGETPFFASDCHDDEIGNQRLVNDLDYTWFDFDCNYCTGVWDFTVATESNPRLGGMFHKIWNAEAPPPAPALNSSALFNYNANPARTPDLVPAGDRTVALAWDNLSEYTPDPKSGMFDFRGYKIWKVSDWTRPVGSGGPSETEWKLLGEFRIFDYYTYGQVPIANNLIDSAGVMVCPKVYIPSYLNPQTGVRGPATVPICLLRGDLWDRQTGDIIRPEPVRCIGDYVDPPDSCEAIDGCIVHSFPCSDPANHRLVNKYPVGRYRYMDREVKNGFLYFYSITAFDSTNGIELSGRRSAVEAEGVAPQASAKAGKGVWVVPNPYRGFARLSERPSAWDLTPNATDPTGTHIDFMGLPEGRWKVRIFTISGDLVAELHSDDPVNDSVRSPVKDSQGRTLPGYNTQQDNARDGQARWNLISRNGQDIVSGIYMFTVDSKYGTERGRFVVIR